MKICVASSGLGCVARGIEAWASDLGTALADRGLDLTLCKGGGIAQAHYEQVLPCWPRDSVRTQRLLRCLPQRFFWRLGLTSGYGIEQTTFAWSLIRHLHREKTDILHAQDPQVAVLVQRARRLGLVRTRTILGHGTNESLEFQSRITYLQHLAPWHLDEARAAGVSRPAWRTIPNFIDTDMFRPGCGDRLRKELDIPAGALVVLVAAAIKRNHKRIDYVLNEFARLRARKQEVPAWLVVAGGWETETDELVAEGKHLLGDRVRFLVQYPRERMPELYRAADLFVLCSLKEMMPIALLEATASGLPCLVHKHPVVEWMIGPGGGSIDMTVDGALAAAMECLLRDSARRQELSDAAREHCVRCFSRERVVDQILEYYNFVMHDAG